MTRNEAYKILYDQYDGSCNHSEEIIDILFDIVVFNHAGRKDYKLNNINRWNIYNPDSLHIVYTIQTDGDIFESNQIIVPISEFAARWRDRQLKSIGI